MNFFEKNYGFKNGYFYSSKLKMAVNIDTSNIDHYNLWQIIDDQYKTFNSHARITPNMMNKLKDAAKKVFQKHIECTTTGGLDIQIGLTNNETFNNVNDLFTTNLVKLEIKGTLD